MKIALLCMPPQNDRGVETDDTPFSPVSLFYPVFQVLSYVVLASGAGSATSVFKQGTFLVFRVGLPGYFSKYYELNVVHTSKAVRFVFSRSISHEIFQCPQPQFHAQVLSIKPEKSGNRTCGLKEEKPLFFLANPIVRMPIQCFCLNSA